jgi:pimeloyl-ACP methyl ester carboxylesterase
MRRMPAVFVHGVPETRRLWDAIRAHLNTDSIALALPGFGTSRPTSFTATKDDYAQWLAHSLDQIAQPIDLVGHDWGALLSVRVATAFDVSLRSWTADMARALHPDYVWNRLARTFQTPEAGEAWMVAARQSAPESPESAASRLALLGVPWDQAVGMGAALDETMSACILDLYRSAVPNVSADWGAGLRAHGHAPGLVLLASADPLNDEDLSIDVARRLAAQTHRFDGLGHAWMTEDPATTAAVLQQFWSSVA